MAGEVLRNGETVHRPGIAVNPQSDEITLKRSKPFVSRAGTKLEHAIESFNINVGGQVCADVGACTGGFTDVLLKRGAARVYAIDVGYGELAWSLRTDPRVVVMERTNARLLEALPEPISCASVDVSFISLRLILPQIARWGGEELQVMALVKPQFEAPRSLVGEGGIVRDSAVHRQILRALWEWCLGTNLKPVGLARSPLRGTEGNIEFLLHLARDQTPERDPLSLIESVVSEGL